MGIIRPSGAEKRQWVLSSLALRGLAKLEDLFDRRLNIGQRTGCGPAVHDKLIHISVRHVLHTTEVGHDDGYGTAHARSATDEDPIIRMVTIDPINRLLKGGRFGFVYKSRQDAYRALRRQGKSKRVAAKIANAGRTWSQRSAMARKGARHRR